MQPTKSRNTTIRLTFNTLYVNPTPCEKLVAITELIAESALEMAAGQITPFSNMPDLPIKHLRELTDIIQKKTANFKGYVAPTKAQVYVLAGTVKEPMILSRAYVGYDEDERCELQKPFKIMGLRQTIEKMIEYKSPLARINSTKYTNWKPTNGFPDQNERTFAILPIVGYLDQKKYQIIVKDDVEREKLKNHKIAFRNARDGGFLAGIVYLAYPDKIYTFPEELKALEKQFADGSFVANLQQDHNFLELRWG